MSLTIQKLIDDSIKQNTLSEDAVDSSITPEQRQYVVFHHEWAWRGKRTDENEPACGRQLCCLVFSSLNQVGMTVLHLLGEKRLIKLTDDSQLRDLEIIQDD